MDRNSMANHDQELDQIVMAGDCGDDEAVEKIYRFLNFLREAGPRLLPANERMHARILFRKWKSWLFSKYGKVYTKDFDLLHTQMDVSNQTTERVTRKAKIGMVSEKYQGVYIGGAALTQATAEIVSAYVSHNRIPASDVGALIGYASRQLSEVGVASEKAAESTPEPVVSIRRSVTPSAIICLICGKPQKILKRHLAVVHDLSADEYRRRFNLKEDYPMIAPDYVAARREIASKLGLGLPKPAARRQRRRAAQKYRVATPSEGKDLGYETD